MDIPIAHIEGIAVAAHGWLFHWRRRLATVAVCGLAMLVGYHVVSGPNGWIAYSKKKVEFRQLQVEVQQLQKENEELERRVKGLQSNPSVIEREAREQLRYVKPGEIVYVLPEPKATVVQPPQSGVAQKIAKP